MRERKQMILRYLSKQSWWADSFIASCGSFTCICVKHQSNVINSFQLQNYERCTFDNWCVMYDCIKAHRRVLFTWPSWIKFIIFYQKYLQKTTFRWNTKLMFLQRTPSGKKQFQPISIAEQEMPAFQRTLFQATTLDGVLMIIALKKLPLT